MISRAVVIPALCRLDRTSLEQRHGCERRVLRPRPETLEREPGFPAWIDVHEDVVVLLLGWLTPPIEVLRIAGRHFDARSARENRVLLGAATAEHQVFH